MQGSHSRASFLVYKPQLVSATLQDECAEASGHKRAALMVAAVPCVAAACHEIWLTARAAAKRTMVIINAQLRENQEKQQTSSCGQTPGVPDHVD